MIKILSILFLTLSIKVQAQNIVHYSGQNFEQFLVPGAQNLLFDSRGFLWIGTINGVARYDGYTYKFYKENPLDSLGFQGHEVYTIFEDQHGGMWVGSDHGVNYLAPTALNFTHIHFEGGHTQSIVEAQDSTLWMTSDSRIVKLSKEEDGESKITIYKPKDESIQFYQLFMTNDHQLVANGNGLFGISFDNDELIVNTWVKDRWVNNIVQAKDGTFFIASDSGYFVKPPGKDIIEKKIDKPYQRYSKVYLDKAGYLWMGFRWGMGRGKLTENYDLIEPEIYPTGIIRSIAEDPSGNLFFVNNKGFLKLAWNNNQYRFISLPEGFEESYAFNFVEDDKGQLWIGTFDGLLTYHPEGKYFDVYREDEGTPGSIPHRSVYSLLKDDHQSIWVATGKGVVRYDTLKKEFLRITDQDLSHHLCKDDKGWIWFVAQNKLYAVDPESLTAKHIEFVGKKKVYPDQIFIDSENILWMASKRDGLQDYLIKDGVLIANGDVVLSVQVGNNESRVIAEDHLGRIWISYTFGVYVIDKKTRKVVRFMNTNNSPLLFDDAFGIVCDQAGYIWLKQHPNGSICIDPKTFEAIAYVPKWLHSGRKGETGRFASVSITTLGEDGKLYTDGFGDFCFFYPDSIRINKVPPTLVLNTFKVNGDIQEDGGSFQSNENSIEFTFSGIHFDDPKLNQYAYFLKGFDKDWSAASRNSEVRYSSLPPGNFQFYAKAANSDGIWSEPRLLSSFTILPVWWQTYTAYVFYILILAGLTILFYRIRFTQKMALAEAEKLKEIDDFKNQFFTNITHEFRTPLTVINGLAERVDGESGIIIRRNADQLLALINQILELSKVEANASRLHPERFDAIRYLKYLLQSFSSLAEEKKILLAFHAEPTQLELELDKTKFALIIQNLITNAIKFTASGGTITTHVTWVNDQLEIQVQDTGIGIDQEELPLIFNRFYQANNQQKTWKGTGIGLALTKELVLLMDGKISVQSESGKGTLFTVTLPGIVPATTTERLVTKQYGHATTTEEPLSEDKLSILLIEDNHDVALLIREILAEQFVVNRAENGRQGVEKALDMIPDVIISDVMMPEMNGLEATQLLKKDSRTSHIPVILLTAKADIDSKLSGLEKGADVYLAKPFHSKELLLNIQNLMRLRDALRNRYSGENMISNESSHPEDKFIARLQTLILGNLSDEGFGIEEICREMGVSRTQLHRKLKALTGKSTSIYVRDIRLAEGKKLLFTGTTSIAEVAYSVGFSDPNYFTRLYSEKYGHPPTKALHNR